MHEFEGLEDDTKHHMNLYDMHIHILFGNRCTKHKSTSSRRDSLTLRRENPAAAEWGLGRPLTVYGHLLGFGDSKGL